MGGGWALTTAWEGSRASSSGRQAPRASPACICAPALQTRPRGLLLGCRAEPGPAARWPLLPASLGAAPLQLELSLVSSFFPLFSPPPFSHPCHPLRYCVQYGLLPREEAEEYVIEQLKVGAGPPAEQRR